MLDLFVLARSLSVLPNMRLKLAAPGVFGKILFVFISARRRSLGAIR